jgi:glycosyltransferase involved in cell wall biosynthesis
MNWSDQCAVVIPCLNEARHISGVVSAVRHYVPTVFVVDDGSQDNTARLAKTVGAEVLQHDISRGKGAALQTGWSRAKKNGFKWALTMDGDGQHSASDILKFFDSVERTGADLVVGNRMKNAHGMPRVRFLVNRWMSHRISALARRSLPDSQCGFRLMNLDTWTKVPVDAAHFEIESDVLLAFAVHKCSIQFVPIEVIYKNEQSKIHPARDTVRWIRWWWRARRYVAGQRQSSPFAKPVLPITSEERG